MIEAVFRRHGCQEDGVCRTRSDRQARGAARDQHLDARCRRDRRSAAAGCRRNAFLQPANVMRLLEIVRGKKRSSVTGLHLARQLGKVVVVGVCFGFVGNRMLARRAVEAERLLLEGALPQEVEAALVKVACRWGRTRSWIWRFRCRLADPLNPRSKAVIEDALRSWPFRSERAVPLRGGIAETPIPDPEIEQIILDASARLGISRKIGPEIVERTVFPMINEGARILEEGIASASRRYRCGLGLWLWLAGMAGRSNVLCRPARAGAGSRSASLLSERSGDQSLRPLR